MTERVAEPAGPGGEVLRRGSIVLEPEAGAPAVIDPGWRPAEVTITASGVGSVGWLLGGATLLLLSWLGVSTVALVADAFDRAPALGWAAVVGLSAGVAMLGWAGWSEARAYRGLRRVERLRALLAGDDPATGAALDDAKAAAAVWVAGMAPRLVDQRVVAGGIAAAGSLAELRDVLRQHVLPRLDVATTELARRAALEAGAMVALCPHPALDALLTGLRGLRAVHEVASLHGQRPGVAASFALLRRVVAAATATAGVDLLSQSLTDQLLQRVPGISHLAAAIPGATVAAVRLYRLARIAAVACSPLSPPPLR